jgi:hypothetical protein
MLELVGPWMWTARGLMEKKEMITGNQSSSFLADLCIYSDMKF